MKDAPAFDFYPERWLAGVAEMSDTDQLVYLRLLCHSWLRDGLPDDVKALSRLAGRKVRESVMTKFPVSEDGRRRNPRLERIRCDQRERIRKKSEQRKAAAEARWSKDKFNGHTPAMRPHENRISSVDAGDMQKPCEADAHHPPLTTHPNLRESTARDPIGVQSEMIALSYPRQDDPIGVMSIIAYDLNDGQDVEQMRLAVAKCADHIRKAPGGSSNRYVPSARRFFETRQWRSPEALKNRWKSDLALKGDQPPKKPVKLTTPAKGGF